MMIINGQPVTEDPFNIFGAQRRPGELPMRDITREPDSAYKVLSDG